MQRALFIGGAGFIGSQPCAALGASPRLVVTDQYRPGDIRHSGAATTRLMARLGHRAQVCLVEGLLRFTGVKSAVSSS
jgi:UDP-glucose 4-epimerase